jgi:hypothetical protein
MHLPLMGIADVSSKGLHQSLVSQKNSVSDIPDIHKALEFAFHRTISYNGRVTGHVRHFPTVFLRNVAEALLCHLKKKKQI